MGVQGHGPPLGLAPHGPLWLGVARALVLALMARASKCSRRSDLRAPLVDAGAREAAHQAAQAISDGESLGDVGQTFAVRDTTGATLVAPPGTERQ